MIKANITIILVPETLSESRKHVEREIAKSLQCNWLLRVEKVMVFESQYYCMHHRMPDGKEVKIHGKG